jgi:hypothetical protein
VQSFKSRGGLGCTHTHTHLRFGASFFDSQHVPMRFARAYCAFVVQVCADRGVAFSGSHKTTFDEASHRRRQFPPCLINVESTSGAASLQIGWG